MTIRANAEDAGKFMTTANILIDLIAKYAKDNPQVAQQLLKLLEQTIVMSKKLNA